MIKVEHLTKYYGQHLAVDDLSFEIEDGCIYGFLGPNGAGKSTTMNIMTGCLSATTGSVLIDGYDIFDEPFKAKQRMGYLPEQPPLYLNETPREYLRFIGEAKGLRGRALGDQIAQVMDRVRIEGVAHRRIGDLSKGYRQRVGIAQALLGSPQTIILDEPTVGLDPLQIIEIRDLIKALGNTHTVILSSHILSEVQAICEKILIIDHGKLVAFDTQNKLEENLAPSSEIDMLVDGARDLVEEAVAVLAEVSVKSIEPQINTEHLRLQLALATDDVDSVTRALFFECAARGVAILEMQCKKTSLEDVFLALTDDNSEEGKQ
ncbi:MAG: ATP-binding cassette domain-containing protein [Peptococcaceae bacterium]|nr:ATP-binding cassette domain-containing protein [Peptococcaceae bacterium]